MGLHLAVELEKDGLLQAYDVTLLGTSLATIEQAEDREKFRALMEELQEPIPESEIVHSLEEALTFAKHHGYPIIVRPAFILGGTGGGMFHTEEDFIEIVQNGIALSPVGQCL